MVNTGKTKRIFHDIAGGFGDVGVFFPIALALVLKNGFHLEWLLFSAGCLYLGAALFFRIPMPVQPLKAMAALALANQLPQEMIRVAGFGFGVVILLMLIPRLSNLIVKLYSLPVIRGIQLALGIMLFKAGLTLSASGPRFAAAAVLLLAFTYLLSNSLPPILPVVIGGLILAFLSPSPTPLHRFHSLQVLPHIPNLTLHDGIFILTNLIIPQIGLTVGNSMVGTIQTSRDLFPERSRRVNMKNLTISISMGNLFSSLFLGLPMCHGAGGLTAHHRFGARSNLATITTGSVFLSLALLSSQKVFDILFKFPLPFLGVLLMVVGIFHANLARDTLPKSGAAPTVLVTALISILTGNLTVGSVAGILFHMGRQVVWEHFSLEINKGL